MNLARELLKMKTATALAYTVATVVAVSPLTVELADGVQIVSPPALGSYTPAVNDVVFVLRPDTGLLVLGNIV